MDQLDREEKQQYLREKILEKNYDAEEFMDFCENYKGNVDIDSWSLQQLKDVHLIYPQIVQKFIQSSAKTLQIDPFSYSHGMKKQDSTESPLDFDWDNAFKSAVPPENTSLSLNLIDLDFLQNFGSPTNSNKSQSP